MTELPDPLRSWAAELAGLRLELVESIGPWLPRLSALVGRSAPARAHDFTGEPDGFDGLSRRGPYERLLRTEWALAEWAPDEFVRRAAQREHLFVELHRVEPKVDRRTVVLFDAGPDQAGAPRLVHLACLVVLARRAVANGSTVVWGHLQHPHLPLYNGVDSGVIERLFSARTHLRPQDSEPWEASLLDGTLWVVGGRDASYDGARRIEIGDPYLPEERVLDVTLRDEPGQPSVRLSLPDDRICGSVIRRPTDSGWTGPSAGTMPNSVRFNLSGTALLIHRGLELYTLKVGRRGWKRPARRWVRDDHRLVAVGWNKQRAVWLTVNSQNKLKLHNARGPSREGQTVDTVPDDLALPGNDHRIGDLLVLPPNWRASYQAQKRPFPRTTVVLDDAQGCFWAVDLRRCGGTRLESKCSRPLLLDGGDLLMLSGPPAGRRWVRYSMSAPASHGATRLHVGGMEDYLRSDLPAPPHAQDWVPVAGHSLGPRHEVLVTGLELSRVRLSTLSASACRDGPDEPIEERTFVGGLHHEHHGFCVVTVEPDKQTICLWSDQMVFWTHQTNSPILWAGISCHGWIAWWEANGQLACRHPSNPKVPRVWSLEDL